MLSLFAAQASPDPGVPPWLSTGGMVTLSLAVIFGFLRGLVVPRWAYNAMVEAKDAEIAERKAAFDEMSKALDHAQAANKLLMHGATISMDLVGAMKSAVDEASG